MANSFDFKIRTPSRILVKRRIYEALKDFQNDLPEQYRFSVLQDDFGFFQYSDWRETHRIAILFITGVETDKQGAETAQFSILCAVCLPSNDETVAAESLHSLAEQVRCCLWGAGCGMGFLNILKDTITPIEWTPFVFKADLETSLATERFVLHGLIDFSITYAATECENFETKHGTGLKFFRRTEC